MNNSVIIFLLTFFLSLSSFANELKDESISDENTLVEYSLETCKKTGIKPLSLEGNATIMPRHDGKYYFIDTGNSSISLENKPSSLKIEEAVAKPGTSITVNSISELIEGGWQLLQFRKLPIVVSVGGDEAGLNVKIVILSLIFSTSDTKAQIGILSALPKTSQFLDENGEAQSLYFGSEVTLRKGGTLDGTFTLIAPTTLSLFSLDGVAKINLATGTGVCMGCRAGNGSTNAFKLNLVGEILLHPNFAVAEDVDGNALTDDKRVAKLIFGVQVPSWDNCRIAATLPSEYGIQIRKFPYIGFKSAVNTSTPIFKGDIMCDPPAVTSGNVMLDLSIQGSPLNIDGKLQNVRGLIFQDFRVRLPKQIKNSDNSVSSLDVNYFFIDDQGKVNTKVTKLGPLVNVKLAESMHLGLNNIMIHIADHQLKSFNIQGDLELPITKGKEDLVFTLGKNENVQGQDLLTFTAWLKKPSGEVSMNLFGLAKVRSADKRPTATAFVTGSGTVNLTTGAIEHLGVKFNSGSFSIITATYEYRLAFDLIELTTQYPYLQAFTLKPNSADKLKVGGFELGLTSLDIKVGDKGEINGDVTITGGLALGSSSEQSIVADVGLKFEAITKTVDGKDKFEFVKFAPSKLYVKATMPTFGFEAGLDIFQNASRLGINNISGIEGKGSFWFNFMEKDSEKKSKAAADTAKVDEAQKAGAGVYLLFAKNQDGQNAWAVDVNLQFGKPGIPIGPSTLNGIYGGAYSNVKIKGDPTAKASGNMGSRTGLSYLWSTGVWGFNLGLDLTTAGKVDISAMLAVQGKVGEGLSFIKAAGYARFQLKDLNDLVPPVGSKLATNFKKIEDKVAKVSKDVLPKIENISSLASGASNATGSTKDGSQSLAALFNTKPDDGNPANRIAAGLIMAYNFGNDLEEASLSIKMYPDIHINLSTGLSNASVSTTGFGILYISKSTKYLYLGNSKTLKDRLGLYFNASARTGLKVSAGVNSYFMLGDGLSSQIPDPLVPDDFLAMFSTKSRDLGAIDKIDANNSQLVAGSGMAFGASLAVEIGMDFLGVASVNAKAGAGFDALLIVDDTCPEGWESNSSAKWKAEAQVYGYAIAKFSVLGMNVLEAGVGFLLKAKLPEPLYAEGVFAAYVKVWKAQVSISINAKFGDNTNCKPIQENKTIADNWNFIQSVSPTTKLSTISSLHVLCHYPTDQTFSSNDASYLQAIEITYVKVADQTVVGTSKKDGISTKTSLSTAVIIPNKGLEKNTKYLAKIRTYIYDANAANKVVVYAHQVNGVTVETKLEQTYEFPFETSGEDIALTAIDVIAYPAKNQYNTYLGDYGGNGYLKVESTTANQVLTKCVGCTYQVGIYQNNQLQGYLMPINLSQGNDFSIAQLPPSQLYELRILAKGNGIDQAIYQGHYFRTSRSHSFSDKVTEMSQVAKANWNYQHNAFEVATDQGSVLPEVFAKDELNELNGTTILPTGGWLYNLNQEFEQYTGSDVQNPGTERTERQYSSLYTAISPSILQQKMPSLADNGEVLEELNIDKSMVSASPIFEFTVIGEVVKQVLSNINGNYYPSAFFNTELLILPAKSSICAELVHEVRNFSYYKDRVWASLPARFSELKETFCFKNEEEIDFRNSQKIQKTVVVHCQKQARDSQPILFTFELKTSDGQLMSFPKGFNIANRNSKAYNTANLGRNELFADVQDKSGKDPVVYSSKLMSNEECPLIADFSMNGETFLYNFEVKTENRPLIKPCLTIRNDPDKDKMTAIDMACTKACALDKDGKYIDEYGCDKCKNEISKFQSNKTPVDYVIESWESDLRSDAQMMPSTVSLTLSNGKVVTFEQGLTRKSIALTTQEALDLQKELSIVTTNDSPFICGENVDGAAFTYNPVATSGEGKSPQEACGSAKNAILYTKSNATELIATQSVLYSEILPNPQLLKNSYYCIGSGANRMWYAFDKNSVYQERNYCVSFPVIGYTCEHESTERRADRNNYTFTFYTDSNKKTTFIPWNIPQEGYNFTFSDGSVIAIAKNEITSSVIYKKVNTSQGCPTLVSSNLDGGIQIITPPKTDCAQKPAKAQLSSPKTKVDFGETINLQAACGTNQVRWYNDATSNTISAKVLAVSSYAAYCLNPATNCLSEKEEITIDLNELQIDSEKDYVCAGSSITLTAKGCATSPTWTCDDASLSLPSGQQISVTPTKETVFTIKCSVDGNNSRYAKSTIAYRAVPVAAQIKSNLPATVSNQICLGQSVTLDLLQGCSSSTSLQWSTGDQSSSIVISPTKTTTYFALCKDNFCQSIASNTEVIQVINVPKASVAVDANHPLRNNTVCSGLSFTLTSKGCESSDEVRWYKDASTTSIATGASLTLVASTSSSYKARCARNIGTAAAPQWCEGEFSTPVSIVVITSNQMAVGLSLYPTTICSYGTATLQASGCQYGVIEWKIAGGNWESKASATFNTNTADAYAVRCNLNGTCFNSEHQQYQDIIQRLTVNPEPSSPNLTTDKQDHTICAGEMISLNGTCSLGAIEWKSPVANPMRLSTSQVFSAICKTDVGCSSQTASTVSVRVNPIPSKPQISTTRGNYQCDYERTTLTASGCNGTIIWNDLSTTNPIVDLTKTKGTYHFSAKCEENACIGEFSDDFPLTVYSRPSKPKIVSSSSKVCTPSTITLEAQGCNGSVVWSDGSTSSRITLSKVNQYTYTVKCIENNCESESSDAVSVEIKRKPSTPHITGASSICESQPTAISYSYDVANHDTFEWVTAPPILSVLGTQTYVAISKNNGCTSDEATFTQVVSPYPNLPIISEDRQCGKTILSVNNCSGVLRWSTEEVANTITITRKGTYTAYCDAAGCVTQQSIRTNEIKVQPAAPSIQTSEHEVGQVTICNNSTKLLQSSFGIVSWYKNGELVWRKSTLEGAGEGSYKAINVLDGCSSDFSNELVITNIQVLDPTDITETRNCGATILTSSCQTGTLNWTASGEQTSFLASYTIPSGNKTYTAQCINQQCVSATKSINTGAIKPTANAVQLSVVNDFGITCGDRDFWLGASGCNAQGTIQWNPSPLETEGLYAKFHLTATTTYSAKCVTEDGCQGAEVSLQVVKKEIPSPPTISQSNSNCTITLKASGYDNGIVHWKQVGFSLIDRGTGASIEVKNSEISAVFPFMATCEKDGCVSRLSNPFAPTAINTAPSWVNQSIRIDRRQCKRYQVQLDTNPCSPTYNTIKEVDTGVTLNCNPSWIDNDDLSCSSEANVTKCKRTQSDTNPNSSTHGTNRTVTESCSLVLDIVTTGSGGRHYSIENLTDAGCNANDVQWYNSQPGAAKLLGTGQYLYSVPATVHRLTATCPNKCGTTSSATIYINY